MEVVQRRVSQLEEELADAKAQLATEQKRAVHFNQQQVQRATASPPDLPRLHGSRSATARNLLSLNRSPLGLSSPGLASPSLLLPVGVRQLPRTSLASLVLPSRSCHVIPLEVLPPLPPSQTPCSFARPSFPFNLSASAATCGIMSFPSCILNAAPPSPPSQPAGKQQFSDACKDCGGRKARSRPGSRAVPGEVQGGGNEGALGEARGWHLGPQGRASTARGGGG